MIQGWLNLQMWNGKYRGTMDMEELCIWRANYKLASFQVCRGLVSLTPCVVAKGSTVNIQWEYQERERWNMGNNNDWGFPQINARHQTTDRGSPEDTKQNWKTNKKQHNCIEAYNIQTTEKSKIKSWKKLKGRKHLSYRGTKIRITSDFSETMQTRLWSV